MNLPLEGQWSDYCSARALQSPSGSCGLLACRGRRTMKGFPTTAAMFIEIPAKIRLHFPFLYLVLQCFRTPNRVGPSGEFPAYTDFPQAGYISFIAFLR